MALTQVRFGLWGQRYGSFANKGQAPQPDTSPHPVGILTQSKFGLWSRRYGSFAGRTVSQGTSFSTTFKTSVDFGVYEYLDNFGRYPLVIESLLTTTKDNINSVAYGGGEGIVLFQNFILDVEHLLQVQTSNSVSASYVLPLSQTINIPLEHLVSLNNGVTLSLSNLLGMSYENVFAIVAGGSQASAFFNEFVLDIESLAGFVKSSDINYEFSLQLLRSLNVNLATLRYLQTSSTLDNDTQLSATKTLVHNVEYLLSLLATNITSIAYEGTQAQSVIRDVTFDIDWLTSFQNIHVVDAEYRRVFQGIPVVNLDYIAQFDRNNTVSIEQVISAISLLTEELGVAFGSGIRRGDPLVIEFGGVSFVIHAREIWIIGRGGTRWILQEDDIWKINSTGGSTWKVN
jgi:hypothetical protein